MQNRKDEQRSVQDYRDTVLRYEAVHSEINQLMADNQGATLNMSDADLTRYRDLARERDELFSQMRWLEQILLDEDNLH